MIRIFNSLTGAKQELRPLKPGRVGIYVCGDTVYDLTHMGHARSKIVFDVVRRYLMHRGYEVDFVRNITDIDDKIIRRAAERSSPLKTSPRTSSRRCTAITTRLASCGPTMSRAQPTMCRG
jgi:cysteinyl-tRNA synthetase